MTLSTLIALIVTATLISCEVYRPCIQKADVVFLLDASTSIGEQNWTRTTEIAADITKYVDVRPVSVLFATVMFNRIPTKQFDLKDHMDHYSLVKALLAIAYPGIPGTKTYLALRDITNKNMFGAEAGGRDDAPDNVIIITDGNSDFSLTQTEATRLKQGGINIITVGIGSKQSQEELNEIASAPEKVFNADSIDLPWEIIDSLNMKACEQREVSREMDEIMPIY
ncbi:collagen alpha-3(VI) chain-like isoform X2 [Physella acuta]|uniref:collagen alpha-3(VI) chain-like isoform X2 n=1 Tax=Physella acuta TaxID=109671 RepID=UPI0027DBD857|nr:collagen alpha-3(VI) chain-like isoform X2 [Physella acuta]